MAGSRRKFLQQIAGVGVACSANCFGRGFAFGQTAQVAQSQSADVARVYIDSR